ncbi:MAG: D-aminoacyl-tRNA deacylase [Pseudonocardiales bacterium]|nr:D-aminoacyl-tRNA deacylase [Pseudonocardiales bacterium]
MRALVQRVTDASVRVEGQIVAQIGPGLLVLLGVTHSDSEAGARGLASKTARLRILRDGDRDEAAAVEFAAPVLVVSQFTLYADMTSGRRPSWKAAAPAAIAQPLVAAFCDELRQLGVPVETGVFGATMAVSSTNDGPMTIWLDAN